MAALSPREKKTLLLTASVAIFALLYHFLWDPFLKEWQKVSADIQAARVHLQKTCLILREKSEIEEAFTKYAGFTLEGEEGSEGVMTEILQEVEGHAQKSRIKVLEMRPLPQRGTTFFQVRGLEFSAEGTAPQFAHFLYSLLGSPNPLKIEKLELSSKSGQDPLLKALIVVTTLTK